MQENDRNVDYSTIQNNLPFYRRAYVFVLKRAQQHFNLKML